MTNQKADTSLNLAIGSTEEELEKSGELDQGYNPVEREWELIVKYSGDLEGIRELAVTVVPLLGSFAIVTVKDRNLQQLIDLPQIEYVEKPKSLYFAVADGRRVSCINAVQDAPFSLSGKGTLVAILDSGIDYANPDFRNADGTTRIVALWDQTIPGNPPEGYVQGTEYTKEQIDEALMAPGFQERMALVPSTDRSGHGTNVAGIAAGNGRGSQGVYRGAAPEAGILVVKLGVPREEGFPRTTELMQAADYVIKKARELGLPVAVNISFGNTYGSHEPYKEGKDRTNKIINYIKQIW